MGRPSTYTDDLAQQLCEKLASGLGLNTICREDGMPPEGTVRHWVMDDVNGFAARYARARDIGLDVLAEEIVSIADERKEDPNSRRVMVDARKWYLSKLAPKRYGDTLKLQGDGEAPLRMIVERMDRKK